MELRSNSYGVVSKSNQDGKKFCRRTIVMGLNIMKNAYRKDVANTAIPNPKLIMEFCLAANLASV